MTANEGAPGRRRYAIAAATFVALTCVVTCVVAGSTDGVRAQQPDDVALRLVDQTFSVEADGTIQLDYELTGLTDDVLELRPPPTTTTTPATTSPSSTTPAGTTPATTAGTETTPSTAAPPTTAPPPPPPIELTVEVINYAPITSPASLDRVVGSDVDPDAFESVSDVVDGVAIDLRPVATIADDGTVSFRLEVPTDVTDSVEDRLKFDRAGLYPVRVQVLIGDPAADDVVATAGTVVQRLPSEDEPQLAPPINLAVVTATAAPPLTAPDSELRAAGQQVQDAIELAAAVDTPVTLEVPPPLIAAATSTPSESAAIADALTEDEFVSMPLTPLDVSSAVAAGRADAYTRLVIDGENALTQAVPTTPTRRDVWIATTPLSAGGAAHLRDLGVRYVVMSESTYRETVDDRLPATDLFVDIALDDGGRLPLLVLDPLAADLTTAAADDVLDEATPTEWAVGTLAAMVIDQQRDDDTDDAPNLRPNRSRVLSTPDFTAPDPRLIGALETIGATTPSVRFGAASTLSGLTDVQRDDGEPVTVQLPASAGPSLTERIALLDATAFTMASAASMLPPDDPRPDQWNAELASLISTGYSDADVTAAIDELLAEADRITGAVVLPEPFTFTLTGRTGTIDIRLGNTIDEPLDVVVHLESSKISFPSGDQTVRLRALDETSVIVPVEARANGTSSIELSVSTPSGSPLGSPVTLTARVTALTGLGQVLTGGFVLVLLTWWFSHWRARRRGDAPADADAAGSLSPEEAIQ